MKTLTHTLRPFLLLSISAAIGFVAASGRAASNVLPVDAAPVVAADDADAAPVQTPFTRDQLIGSLTRSIAAHFNLEGELQIELQRAWVLPSRLAASWELTVVEFPTTVTGTMMVRCRLAADGAAVSDASLVLRAQLWRDVWVTRQPLVTGSAFDASALETRRVDTLRDREALPASVGDRTYIFARGVSAGRMLTWRDVARRPLVRKGDTVEVSAVDGPLSVTMKATALENGAQGETVTVRNPESRKIFAALVVDENRVQIRF
ncbi:flagellar basal body P-ring formation chaperone FlgA [Horticoccus sp. 23ND18S-11]|uniref:flagellar basal body P-ring formation chaperone FlgA n=1 Tax=Horticoccus sp. 23ND18S-11 TaxID=3391832 RepID=UPI0039C8EC2B